MKNKFLMVGIVGVMLSLFLAACDTDSGGKANTYYYEAYRITMTQYTSFANAYLTGQEYTPSQIKSFRAQLKNYGGTSVESKGGVSESELQTFASQHGLGGSDYTTVKNRLDAGGNAILFFGYAPDTANYIIWVYIEKE